MPASAPPIPRPNGFAHIRDGRFEAAWRISDQIMNGEARRDLPRHLTTLWHGAPLTGRRLLIRCYRGLGDTIQFIRYAPLIKACARQVIVSTQAELVPLLRTMPAIDRVIALDRDPDPRDWDLEVEVTELPHVFRTTLRTIPAQIPYFRVAPAPLPETNCPAVGIVWAAGDWDHRRTIPLSELAPLFSSSRWTPCPLISLALSVCRFGSCSTRTPWRWMRTREDSPWYPTMRLFRQNRPGDWRPVLRRVAAELDALRAAGAGHDSQPAAQDEIHFTRTTETFMPPSKNNDSDRVIRADARNLPDGFFQRLRKWKFMNHSLKRSVITR